jgi:hypothetical protein
MPLIALEIGVLGELAQAVRILLKSVAPPAAPAAEPPVVLPDEAVVVLPVAVASVEPAAPLPVLPVVEPAAAVSVEPPDVEPPVAPMVEPPAAPVAPPDAAAVSPEAPDIASCWPALYPLRNAVWDAESIAVRSEQSMPAPPADEPEDWAATGATPHSNAAAETANISLFMVLFP